jgi:hypothetical protein
MIAVIRITIVVMSLFLAAIVGVRTVSAAQKSPIVALFSTPDGSPCVQPCMFGVRPGETLFNDAVQLLKQHPLLVGFEDQITLGDSGLQYATFGKNRVEIYLEEDNDDRVLFIRLELFPPGLVISPFSFGDLVLFFGVPEYVSVGNYQVAEIGYHYFHLNYARPGTHTMSVNDQFERLFVRAFPLDEPSRLGVPWQGFTTIARYARSTKR